MKQLKKIVSTLPLILVMIGSAQSAEPSITAKWEVLASHVEYVKQIEAISEKQWILNSSKYLIDEHTVWYSEDSGINWKKIYQGIQRPDYRSIPVALSASSQGRIWIDVFKFGSAVNGRANDVYYSDDLGTSWKFFASLPYGSPTSIYACRDGLELFLPGKYNPYQEQNLFRFSKDGRLLSQVAQSELFRGPLYEMDDGTLYGIRGGSHMMEVQVSKDRGLSWHTLFNSGPGRSVEHRIGMSAFQALTSQEFFYINVISDDQNADRKSYLVRSLDGGKTFQRVNVNDQNVIAFAVDPSSRTVMYVTKQSVYVSTDLGTTWTALDDDIGKALETITSIKKAPGKYWVIGGLRGIVRVELR